MRYLLIISAICLLLTTTANARNLDFGNSSDQLYMSAIAAGTYLTGRILISGCGWDKTQGYLGGAIIVGTAAFLIDHYGGIRGQTNNNKTQGMIVGVGVALTLGMGFGL